MYRTARLSNARICSFLHTRQVVRSCILRSISTAPSVAKIPGPPLAFVFDIDGVLIRGAEVLPAAKRALRMLEGNNVFGLKIPYILLTNGGGVSEQERCQSLTAKLGFPIDSSQYIQAHTIVKTLAHKYSDQGVLVLGGKLDKVRQVAEGYGLKKAYTTLDVLAWNPKVWPFHRLSEAELGAAKPVDFSRTPISAIFVFHDPRNWALDVQVVCDVIQSGGIIGGPYISAENRSRKPIELIFCNPDLLWRSDFEQPRLGQGAFKEAFQAVYKALTGSTYPLIQYGKPTEATYKFAEQVVKSRLEDLYGLKGLIPPIYMIGDNPESDIAGANAAHWNSILVRTGVFNPQQGPPSHPPSQQVEDVEKAVHWAINREFELRNSRM